MLSWQIKMMIVSVLLSATIVGEIAVPVLHHKHKKIFINLMRLDI